MTGQRDLRVVRQQLEQLARRDAPPPSDTGEAAERWLPDVVTFASHPEFLGLSLYPRQATLLKIAYLGRGPNGEDLFTDYDHAVIDEWCRDFEHTREHGLQPDLRERIELLRGRGERRFREIVFVGGRRAGKGLIGSILFTASIPEESLRPWRKRYSKEWGIRLIGLKETAGGPYIKQSPPYPILRRSRQVYDWLKQQDFDYCHFEDWQPEGFMAIQAKRTGQAFARTKLIFGLHGNPEWSRDGMLAYEDNWTLGLTHEYMDRYCAEHADLLLSPSQHMFEWAQAHHWTLQPNRRVIPYLFELPFEPQPKPFAQQHIIFFGRLETRKGLVVFVRALQAMATDCA